MYGGVGLVYRYLSGSVHLDEVRGQHQGHISTHSRQCSLEYSAIISCSK